MDSTVNDGKVMQQKQAQMPAQSRPMQVLRYKAQIGELQQAIDQLEKQEAYDQQKDASDRAGLSQAMQAGPSLVGPNGHENLTEMLNSRSKQYGKFSSHSMLTQTLEQVFYQLMQRNNPEMLATLTHSQRESLHMIFHKLGRLGNGNPHHRDSWLDIAGYAQLIADELDEF